MSAPAAESPSSSTFKKGKKLRDSDFTTLNLKSISHPAMLGENSVLRNMWDICECDNNDVHHGVRISRLKATGDIFVNLYHDHKFVGAWKQGTPYYRPKEKKFFPPIPEGTLARLEAGVDQVVAKHQSSTSVSQKKKKPRKKKPSKSAQTSPAQEKDAPNEIMEALV